MLLVTQPMTAFNQQIYYMLLHSLLCCKPVRKWRGVAAMALLNCCCRRWQAMQDTR